MDVEYSQVVYSAANALVGAMVTDSWRVAKTRFGRWFKRHRQAEADDVLGRLEELREELVRARLDPDPERFWRLYEQLQAAVTIRLETVTADDRIAQAELDRLRSEWLALPGVPAQTAGSAARLTRVYGELLVEPRVGGESSVAGRSVSLPGGRVANLAPPTTSRFIDREELIERLSTRIGERDVRIINLCGEGGIGKTALALKLWELVASSFPHGLLYVDLRGTTGESALEPGSALDRFLRALGVDAARVPGDEQERLDLYRSLTAELDVVVLLDDAASFAQVRPLISASPSALTVVTSRDPLRGLVEEYGAVVVSVPPLDDANSLRLLRAVAGLDDAADPATTPVSDAELEARVRRCSGIPIAVRIEAARLAVGESQAPTELAAHEEAGGPSLLAGYRDLPPEAVRLHRLLCVHPWPSITAGPAAAVLAVDEPTGTSLLRRLFEANLLERARGGTSAAPRYRVHDRVREEVVRGITTVGDANDASAAVRAIVRWYLAFAVEADWQVIPRWHLGPLYAPLDERRRVAERAGVPERGSYPDRNTALAALEAELDNLVEAVRAADQHLLHDLVSQLCEALWSVFFRRGHHQEWIAVHRLGIGAATASGDLRMQARLRVQLAFGLMGQDRLAEAADEFELASAADRAAGHDQGLATALESFGLLSLRREDYDRATELLLDARSVAERVGNPRALALLEHHYGRALSGLGRFEEADGQFDRATAAFRKLPTRDVYNEGRILMSRGEAALRSGHPERAADVLAEAAEIMVKEESVVMQAQVAVLQAWCARESGDLAAERGHLVAAQELHTRTGSRLAPRVSERITFLDVATRRLS